MEKTNSKKSIIYDIFTNQKGETKVCKTTDQQNENIINLTPIEKLNIKQIVKRNGEVVDFNIEKIENAIKLAGEATTPFSPEQIIKLTNNVI